MNDLISRQVAIDALEEPCKVSDTWTDEFAVGERSQWEKDVKALNNLPSAQPELTDEEKRLVKKLRSYHNGSYAKVIDKLLAAASAQPERKKGKWMHDKDDALISGYCSRCGWESIVMETDVADMPFCPNCGADMRGEEE